MFYLKLELYVGVHRMDEETRSPTTSSGFDRVEG